MITLTLTAVERSGKGIVRAIGTAKLTGNYATGGDTVNWASLVGQQDYQGKTINPNAGPLRARFDTSTGQIVDTYVYNGNSASLTGALLLVLSAFNTQIGAGAYSAGLLADVISFMAEFQENQA